MAVFRTIPAGDLEIRNGDLVLLDGVQYIRQKLSCRFRFFLGEWFLDRREGIPYYRDVFVANPNLDVVRSLLRRVALKTPGVVSLTKFELQYDPAERRLSFDFEATVSGGIVVVGPDDDDFLVDVNLPDAA